MKTTNSITLTKTQSLILHGGADRSDGACCLPNGVRPSAAQRSAAKLIEQGFVKEIKAKAKMPIWRTDDTGRPYSLVVTKLGRSAVRSADDASDRCRENAEPSPDPDKQILPRVMPRDGSKIAQVIVLLGRDEGASLSELIGATGWLPHTTRAALTGLRQRGYSLSLEPRENGEKAYRIAEVANRAMAS